MKVLENGKYLIEDDEEESFRETEKRFQELCETIKFKKATLRILEDKANTIYKDCDKIRRQIKELKNEEREYEIYFIKKHKKTHVLERKVNKLFLTLTSLTDKEKLKYLMRNKSAYELFESIDFDYFIEKYEERGTNEVEDN
jgi:hypothetical protein